FSSSLQEAVQLRATMKQDLQKALSREEFKIYYQPQIKVADNSLGGVEALLRWQHPKLGLLSPSAFMNIAEETGLIVDIGSWVLREACGQMKRWQDRCPGKHQKLSLAVNLSAVQVKSHTLGEVIKSVISAFSFGLGCLELEITESALIQDASATVALLNEITEQGIVLSLDDFGTGYSSLEHLKLFPISVLKIDRGFVSAIGQDKKGEQLLVAIIAFARALEMKVIAEGIENKEQAEFCALHGCDLLQGYYYACPIPADEFERMFLLH
ncbi:MAG: EAL domain-containing protein, partial [Pseudomonadota bacterium]